MAKIYGLFGTMTGKMADVVMVVRNGVQLARKYQPIVSNPSTPAQVEARAKMKLMSQLSAVVGNVIAMPRNGTVSPRNLFVKTNYDLVNYSNNTADIDLSKIKLTKGVVAIPQLSVNREEGNNLNVSLSTGASDLSRVVYIVLSKESNGSLRMRETFVVSTPGASNTFPERVYVGTNESVILAYGIRDNNEKANTKFSNLEAINGEVVAKIIATRMLTELDVTLTATTGITVPIANATES